MAKFDMDEIGKPGKPPKQRRFPWRLWLFALVMTAGAGAGGYYTWQFRQKSTTAIDDANTCLGNLGKVQAKADDAVKKSNDCITVFDSTSRKNKELEAQLAAVTSKPNSSKDEIEDIQKQLAKMASSGQLKITARRGSAVLAVPSDTLFASGTAELLKPGELALLEIGITIKRMSDRRFLVIGHTDDAPLKSATYKDNWELSTARALAVARFFVQAGMDPKNLLASGAGDNDPIGKDRAKNARIEIVLLPAIQDLPALPASLGADTAKSDLPKLEATKPEPPRPDAAKPAPPKAEAAKPDATKPEAAKPDPAKPAAKP